MIRTTTIQTPIGEMTAAATGDGICLLAFGDRYAAASDLAELSKLLNTRIGSGWNMHLWTLKKQLKEYFRGKRKKFTLPLVIPGSDFQQIVWKELQNIPYGATISYLEQAENIKNPKAVRAVAGANGSNRIAILIPCHRVIGSDGSLIGYGGGLEKKKWLIDHERKYSGKPVEGTLF